MNLAHHKKKALLILLITFGIASGLIYSISQENITYYYTIGEILENPSKFKDAEVRVLGLVEPGSLQWIKPESTPSSSNNQKDLVNLALRMNFNILAEDGKKMAISYQGVKPDLFKEGQGVVVEGKFNEVDIFQAKTLLVKHSEEYKSNKEQVNSKETYYKSLEQK